MPDEDKRQPSLEPPKLFGRRKKEPEAEPEPRDEPTAAIPEPEPFPEPVPRPEPVPEPTPVPEPEPTPMPAPEPEPVPAPEPEPGPEPAPMPDDGAVAAQEPPAARTLATAVPLFADEVAPTEKPSPAPERDRRRRSRRVPRGQLLSGYPASAVTGLLVGGLLVALTTGALRACEGIRGTSTCGGPGLLLLVMILVVLVLVGQVLLRLFDVPDPGSTSFLAVGLIAVVALLFLIDVILDWQMIIVIPLLGVGSFLLSHWVTTTFVEPADS